MVWAPVKTLATGLRTAIVHEWFTRWAGSEQVLEQMLQVVPQADVFAITSRPDVEGQRRLAGRTVRTSFIQRLPLGARMPQMYLPWLPWAVEGLDVRAYDLVICSSHCVAKGVIARPGACQVAYVHSPMRYAWDLQDEYLRRVPALLQPWWSRTMHGLRQWDTLSAARLDHIAANSGYIAQRIRRAWRREASVIHPPVDVTAFSPGTEPRGGFFVTASRLVGYKRVPLIAEAFARRPDLWLTIIGDGADMPIIRRIAARAPNISVLGHVTRERLIRTVQTARAFVFAAEEDFGIAPVEAMACGTPVIAFGRGGAAESVVDGQTGLFFDEQTVASLTSAIERFLAMPAFDPGACVRRADEFSQERFRERFAAFLATSLGSA
jgi:glycosyltransferase involved in cell wall biosynthesis